MLTVYNFEIFYRFNKINSTNKSSKRFDYKEISTLNTKLLSTLQNKLTLSFIENKISITQNKQNNFKNLSFLFSIYTLNAMKIVVDETSFVNIKKQILNNFASMFQLTNVAIIISRKNVKIISKNSYEKSQKLIKFLIKKF